jgi:hypothetical protein
MPPASGRAAMGASRKQSQAGPAALRLESQILG